jgi:CheY-like chemotaxis protein
MLTLIKTETKTAQLNTNDFEQGDRQKHIVIVEDDKNCMTALRLMLDGDYLLTYFDKAEEALEYIVCERQHIDLILLDDLMPDMTGRQMLAILKKVFRQDEVIQRIPVIMQTATSDDDVGQALSPSDVCILKPYSRNELLKTIETVMAKNELRCKQ